MAKQTDIKVSLSAKDVQRLEELESQVARVVHENANLRRDRDRLYNRLRGLENAIRAAVVVGEVFNGDALYQLRQRVPSKPRPTLKELRNRK